MNEHADSRQHQRSIDIDLAYARTRLHTKGHMMRTRWDPTYQGSWAWRSGGAAVANPDVRVSDAERNEVADKLARHFADGRLDQAEFKERLDTAMSAKTQGDLAGLFDDLPLLAVEPPPSPRRRRRLIPFVLIVAFIAVAASPSIPFTHGLHFTWLLFVLAGLFFWSRAGHPHSHHRHHHGIEAGDH
jgi:hypothetical protein